MKLPDVPSELLRLALADLRKAEADTDYLVDMGTWHHEKTAKRPYCLVCMGGAVMAFSLGAKTDEWWTPRRVGGKEGEKLLALDSLREGDIEGALKHLGIEDDGRLPRLVWVGRYPAPHYKGTPDYGDRVEDFHRSLGELADRMESVGL